MYGTWCEDHFIPKKLTVKMENNGRQHSLNFTYFGATVPFRSSKRLGKGDGGQAANNPTKTPTRTWWNTKAWSELSPPGLPQLSMGLGANSGKH